MVVIYYGRSEKEAAVQGGAVLSSGEPDRASGVLLRPLHTCMRNNDIFTGVYSLESEAHGGCVFYDPCPCATVPSSGLWYNIWRKDGEHVHA